MAESWHEADHDEVPETMVMAIERCPSCGMIHIGMLDNEHDPITEMTLGDDDVVRLAVQLLRAVYPSINSEQLIDKIKIVSGPLQ